MEIVVKMFASMRERVGAKQVTVHLPEGATVTTLRQQLAADHPGLVPAMPSGIVAVNKQFVPLDTILQPGDEAALFPPVSGGAGTSECAVSFPTYCEITDADLNVNDWLARLTLPSSGAVVAFTGVVRASDKTGALVSRLFYEAYVPMAQAKLRQVADEMRQRFPEIEGIALVQRTGTLQAGAPTIVVAVSSPHRDQGCFEAARYGIDRIKEIVPVWKKEIGSQGEVWIEGHYVPEPGD